MRILSMKTLMDREMLILQAENLLVLYVRENCNPHQPHPPSPAHRLYYHYAKRAFPTSLTFLITQRQYFALTLTNLSAGGGLDGEIIA